MAAGNERGGLKQRVRANWANAVLVCAKCSKKLDGGFGKKGKQPLGKALRKHLDLKKGRKGRRAWSTSNAWAYVRAVP